MSSKKEIPQATSPLAVWLDYLQNIHSSAIDLGLERVQLVADKANLTKPANKVITVAGTNGKGSTCAILEAILLDAGYSVGVYSSPHLIHYNERVRINGETLPDEEHTAAFDFVEQQRGETSLSFFEYATMAALKLFQQHKVEVVLLEVGLGGRLDATNVVDHDVSVITSLAIDHVDWLGDDINIIGREKAGIFRKDKPAICGQPDAPISVAEVADEVGAKLHQVGFHYRYKENDNDWIWQSGAFDLPDLPKPELPIANAATAIMALGVAELDISDVNIVKGLQNARLAGRMQTISHNPQVILDVAHNPHSAAYLVEQVNKLYPDKTVHCVLGMLHDKDIQSTIEAISPVVNHWYPASLQGPRAASAQELLNWLPEGCSGFTQPVEAYRQALANAKQDELILVVGSFLTVADILQYQQQESSDGK